jgi:TonB-dependent Receptor Plug Domain
MRGTIKSALVLVALAIASRSTTLFASGGLFEVPTVECATILGSLDIQPVGTDCRSERLFRPAGDSWAPSMSAKLVPTPAISAGVVVVVKTTVKVISKPSDPERTEGYDKKISEKDIERSAGTFGDPSRFLQLLPGVVSDNDQFNDFIVRGGNPDETLFVIDNIEVPSVNQLALSDTTGGFVSMIDNAAIQNMTLHTDTYDSKYDQRLSAVVEFSTRPEGNVLAHSESEIGIAGAGMSSTRPWGNDGSIFFSARRSVLNLLTNDIGLNGVPIYNNFLVRGEKRLDENNNLWGLSLTGIDSINIHPSPTDSFETNPYDIRYHGWRNTTGLNWQHIYTPRSFSILSLSNSQQSQTVVDSAQLQDEANVYSENTGDGITVAKFDGTAQSSSWLILDMGVRAAIDRLAYVVNQPLGLQNPYSTDPSPEDSMAMRRRFAAFSSAQYSEASFLLPHQMKLVLGQRFSQWAITGSSLFTPRVLFSAPLLGRMLHVGYAEYGQLPPNLYLVSFSNDTALKPIRSKQLTAGMDVLSTSRINMTIEGYRKHYFDYPVALNYPQLSLANVADTFGQAFLLFPMVSKGRGVANGAELSVHYKACNRLTLATAFTYSRSWYSGLDGALRRGDYDLPIVANISGNYDIGKRSTLTFRYSGTSGKPYTPDNIALSDAQERDVYDLTEVNAVRAPAYSRLDFRLEHSREISRGTLTWHVGLENALGASNFYSNEWRPRAGDLGVLPQDQMPRFPDGGIQYSY